MPEMEDWQVLLGVFPASWEQEGRNSGAVKRLRGFASIEALLRTLLLYVGGGWSLRETAVQARLAGIADVSNVTLLNRLRDAEGWLRQLCQQLWRENGVDLQPPVAGRTVRVLDGAVVREPGRTGSQWRVHYSLQLPTLKCDHFVLTPTHGQGSAERLGTLFSDQGSWCWPMPDTAIRPLGLSAAPRSPPPADGVNFNSLSIKPPPLSLPAYPSRPCSGNATRS